MYRRYEYLTLLKRSTRSVIYITILQQTDKINIVIFNVTQMVRKPLYG